MSARPFMQLYVSDYLGDTMHLTCEQHGAYILLLMSMWQADGTLPNDRKKLARICRMTPAKFKGVSSEVLPYFRESGAHLTHARLSKELQKANEKHAKRVSAGSKGGRAKSLKNIKPTPSNATAMPKHLPETRNHIDTTATSANDKTIPQMISEAAGNAIDPMSSRMAFMGDIVSWVQGDNPCDLHLDLLPTLRLISERVEPRTVKTWNYYRNAVFEARDRRLSIPANPAPKERAQNAKSNYSTPESRAQHRFDTENAAAEAAIRSFESR